MAKSGAWARGRPGPGGRRPARGAWFPLLGAGSWLLSMGVGCSEVHDPLTERCLEALAYHSPTHGRVEGIERGPSENGWTVTILHGEGSSDTAGPLDFSCEYEIGNRWRFLRISVGGQELRESELALVNAELFLRDLRRSSGRFGDPQGPAGGVSAPPPSRT